MQSNHKNYITHSKMPENSHQPSAAVKKGSQIPKCYISKFIATEKKKCRKAIKIFKIHYFSLTYLLFNLIYLNEMKQHAIVKMYFKSCGKQLAEIFSFNLFNKSK
ncbi:hypothetical protein ACKWTF_000989 [Chironomus riparius]